MSLERTMDLSSANPPGAVGRNDRRVRKGRFQYRKRRLGNDRWACDVTNLQRTIRSLRICRHSRWGFVDTFAADLSGDLMTSGGRKENTRYIHPGAQNGAAWPEVGCSSKASCPCEFRLGHRPSRLCRGIHVPIKAVRARSLSERTRSQRTRIRRRISPHERQLQIGVDPGLSRGSRRQAPDW